MQLHFTSNPYLLGRQLVRNAWFSFLAPAHSLDKAFCHLYIVFIALKNKCLLILRYVFSPTYLYTDCTIIFHIANFEKTRGLRGCNGKIPHQDAPSLRSLSATKTGTTCTFSRVKGVSFGFVMNIVIRFSNQEPSLKCE